MTDTAEILNIAKEFSDFPVGRDRNLNKYSGDRFRDDYIVPRLREGAKVTIDFTGIFAAPPSFLDEAFGGLVRKYKSDEDLLNCIQQNLDFLVTGDKKYDGYNDRAKEYLNRALVSIGRGNKK